MRIRFLFALVLALFIVLAANGVTYAMPSDADSNTAQMAGDLPFVLGLGASGDWVLDRNLENDRDQGEDMESKWYGGNIYFDPFPQWHLNLFLGVAEIELGSLGMTGLSATEPFGAVNTLGTRGSLETETSFAIGGSTKVDIINFPVFPDQPNMEIFGVGGYRYTSADVDEAKRGPTPATTLEMNVELHEWQGGGGVAQRIKNVIPDFELITYVGSAYSDVSLNLSGTNTFARSSGPNQTIVTGKRESEDLINVFTGLQVLTPGNRWTVNVEGRFINETAVSVDGRFRW